MERVKAAVVGAGSMGRHHARILTQFADVDLVAVADPAPHDDVARVATEEVAVVPSLGDLPDVDFAVVAVPTSAHVPIALELIERGVALLVEKPLASTPEDAERLAAAAEDAGVMLAVGHVERFNPAVSALARMLDSPRLLQFERLSPYTPRISESVVADLMVHDLDLACWMCGGYPVRIQAAGCAVLSDTVDVASAVLEFPSGAVAALQASRVTQNKVRRIAVSETDRYLVTDTVRQDLAMYRQTSVEYTSDEIPVYRQASVVEIPYLDRSGEPLAYELRDALDALALGRPPLVTGRAGADAVRLVAAVEASIAGVG